MQIVLVIHAFLFPIPRARGLALQAFLLALLGAGDLLGGSARQVIRRHARAVRGGSDPAAALFPRAKGFLLDRRAVKLSSSALARSPSASTLTFATASAGMVLALLWSFRFELSFDALAILPAPGASRDLDALRFVTLLWTRLRDGAVDAFPCPPVPRAARDV